VHKALAHVLSLLQRKPTAAVPLSATPAQPAPIRPIPHINLERQRRMQTLNQSTACKYTGVIEYVLAACNCLELSQITPEHLDRFLAREGATGQQRSTLFALWNGQQEVPQALQSVLAEICWPAEKARLIKFLGGRVGASAETDELLQELAWR
jgi:hypothetical protein